MPTGCLNWETSTQGMHLKWNDIKNRNCIQAGGSLGRRGAGYWFRGCVSLKLNTSPHHYCHFEQYWILNHTNCEPNQSNNRVNVTWLGRKSLQNFVGKKRPCGIPSCRQMWDGFTWLRKGFNGVISHEPLVQYKAANSFRWATISFWNCSVPCSQIH